MKSVPAILVFSVAVTIGTLQLTREEPSKSTQLQEAPGRSQKLLLMLNENASNVGQQPRR